MAHTSRPHRSMVIALLAPTAAASLLGACGQTGGGLFSRGQGEVQMTAAEAAEATSQWADGLVHILAEPKPNDRPLSERANSSDAGAGGAGD